MFVSEIHPGILEVSWITTDWRQEVSKWIHKTGTICAKWLISFQKHNQHHYQRHQEALRLHHCPLDKLIKELFQRFPLTSTTTTTTTKLWPCGHAPMTSSSSVVMFRNRGSARGGGGEGIHASPGQQSASGPGSGITDRERPVVIHESTNKTTRNRSQRLNSSSGSGSRGSPMVAAAAAAANRELRAAANKPCCFCWCCCCTCSWIRRQCLSVKTPNGSLENPTDLIKDEELGSISLSDIKSWGDSFEKLMASEKGRKVFRSFLRCEYSEENILFWLACEDLKQERSPELIEEKARIIYEDYVSILSPREVSLDSRVREIINRNMIAPSPHTFDEAQLQIYTLMHRDSYPRFVNSNTYKELLRSVGGAASASASASAAPVSSTASAASSNAPSANIASPAKTTANSAAGDSGAGHGD